jgi:hypothetical protein
MGCLKSWTLNLKTQTFSNLNCYLQGLEEVKRLSTKVDSLAAALARIEVGMKDTSGGTPKFGASFKGGGANWRRGNSSANVLKVGPA